MSRNPQAFDKFAATRSRTLELVAPLSQVQITFSTDAKSWSVGEVLDHLTKIDNFFRDELGELVRRSAKRGGKPVTLIRSLSDAGFEVPFVPKVLTPLFDVPAAMAAILVPRPVRQAIFGNRAVPAKAPAPIRPTPGRPADELLSELQDFSVYIQSLLDEHPKLDWGRLNYYNPLTGLTDVLGLRSFLSSHETRHQRQIGDILAAKGFPE